MQARRREPQNARTYARTQFASRGHRVLRRVAGAVAFPLAALGVLLPAAAEGAFESGAFQRAVPAAAEGALIIGLILFAGAAAIAAVAARRRWADRETELAGEAARLRARLDRAEVLLAASAGIVIVWRGADDQPDVEGDLALLAEDPSRRLPLSFGSWLAAATARELGARLVNLRARGEAFRATLVTLDGRHLDVEGRPAAGLAMVRIGDVSAERMEAIRLQELEARAKGELKALWAMLEASPNPAWLRDGEGRLTLVNSAYARAVEAANPDEAVARNVELLEMPAREASREARATGAVWRGRAPAVVVGERRLFDVIDAPSGEDASPGSAVPASVGMASDVTELQGARDALEREKQAHARTLDQLSTAVVIFDRSKRLVFHNAAYRQLWGLDQAWLDEKPTDAEILDRLRAARLIPEQTDFRVWKESLLAAYQSIETEEQAWYLPDERTLRIVINPNPQGGVTYLYDDVTERFRLESQFNAAIRVQSETLDTLKEGVAVFGSDGRLKLFNPAFADLWGLEPGQLGDQPHIDRVAELCAPLFMKEGDWNELRAVVAGLQDQRLGFENRLARRDGAVLDCAAAPLPDGATLITFIDATPGVNVERALTERNQALIEAERLRNDFVHHVSYELRSPLTNIIGFIQLLGDPSVGPLNARQLEYAGYVTKSSSALLAIINDILDLASIDADAMELSLEEIDVAETMRAAAEGLEDRVAEAGLTLSVIPMQELGSFVADGKRIRQILMNLLSNAIGFSAPGSTIGLAALRRGEEIVFKVSDQGRGIPREVVDHIFDRFKTHTAGSRHRGVGLGLSIARSFVELHGGRILIDSAPGEGTTVTCIFPTKSPKVGEVESQGRERNGG
ncbi:PAS domain-containing sensor histidine kinase [Methylocella silvestris]|uniref:histidine kinase n=1 Tax=Methylocella silvestris TaxID=199596 RepID=A0A2J7TGT4_METSI|nr:PAS domain-containing sensor histidine kinase [Methylocella silvestris]PNG25978.1 two-component sensor histidine kinase [Methylocella silvestris]